MAATARASESRSPPAIPFQFASNGLLSISTGSSSLENMSALLQPRTDQALEDATSLRDHALPSSIPGLEPPDTGEEAKSVPSPDMPTSASNDHLKSKTCLDISPSSDSTTATTSLDPLSPLFFGSSTLLSVAPTNEDTSTNFPSLNFGASSLGPLEPSDTSSERTSSLLFTSNGLLSNALGSLNTAEGIAPTLGRYLKLSFGFLGR